MKALALLQASREERSSTQKQLRVAQVFTAFPHQATYAGLRDSHSACCFV